jgi:hypothetical protein
MLSEEYKDNKRAWAEISQENAKLLADFEQWLVRRVASGTIQRHLQDVEPYINTFLLYKGAATASPGARRIAKFLVYWFIRRATWANPTSIKENAASLEKFCSFMQEKGEIDASALKDLKQTIKEAMDERLKAMDE